MEQTHGIATFTQVLVLYHEMIDESQMTDYFARIFHPIPVLAIMGRSALADPPVKKDEAVFYNWKVAGDSKRHAVAYLAFNRVLLTLAELMSSVLVRAYRLRGYRCSSYWPWMANGCQVRIVWVMTGRCYGPPSSATTNCTEASLAGTSVKVKKNESLPPRAK